MKKLTIYDKCLKENTFLSTFCKLCSNTNTPTIFDFWQGVYCLSSILNRKVIIEIDDRLHFPNIYCLFVSDNSEFLENAQKVLESVEFLMLYDKNHEFINSYTAPNSLIEMLAKRSDKKELNNIRIAVSSMDTFFKSKDSVKLITDLYSCPTTRRGYNGKSKYEFNNVYFTLSGKCSADDYFENVKTGTYDTEFLSRTITIAANKAKTCEKLGDFGEQLSTITEEIQEKTKNPVYLAYDSYAARLLKRLARNNSSKRYGARPYELAVKLSGLLAINDGSEKITIDHVKNAYKLIEAVQRQLNIFITKREFAESHKQLNEAIKKVIDLISSAGENGISHYEIYQKVRYYITNEEYSQIMTILFEYNLINKYMSMNGKGILYAPNENTTKLDNKSAIKIIKTLLNVE